MMANVPTMDIGSAMLGMMVAETFRKNRKITMMTRKMVSNKVNFTSFTDSRIDCERSNTTLSFTAAGICFWMVGSNCLIESTTATVFVPGCFWMASVMARSPLNQLAILSFST